MTDGKSDSGSNIRKRTPLEQAIAKQVDPRVRWDERMKALGFKRTSMMVHESRLEEVKAFIRKVNDEASGRADV